MATFGRQWELLFIKDGRVERLTDPYRVQFRVVALPGIVGSVAQLAIANAPQDLRRRVSRRFADAGRLVPSDAETIQLAAGVEEAQVIHRGLPVLATTSKQGPEFVTAIESNPSVERHRNSDVQRAWPEAPVQAIVDELLDTARLGRPSWSAGALATVAGQRMTVSASGGALKAVKKILDKFDLVFVIDHFGVRITEMGTTEPGDQVPLIAEETGMIGPPKITKTGVQVRTVLRPDISVLRPFDVRAQTLVETLDREQQRYFAQRVEHVGDTRGDRWETRVTGFYEGLSTRAARQIETIKTEATLQ